MASSVDLSWRGEQVIRRVRNSMYRGLVEVGEIIGDESQKVTPKDTEELANSLQVIGDESKLEVKISYGVDDRYALEQHENLTYYHSPGEQAKYLENPVNTLAPALLTGILTEILQRELS